MDYITSAGRDASLCWRSSPRLRARSAESRSSLLSEKSCPSRLSVIWRLSWTFMLDACPRIAPMTSARMWTRKTWRYELLHRESFYLGVLDKANVFFHFVFPAMLCRWSWELVWNYLMEHLPPLCLHQQEFGLRPDFHTRCLCYWGIKLFRFILCIYSIKLNYRFLILFV